MTDRVTKAVERHGLPPCDADAESALIILKLRSAERALGAANLNANDDVAGVLGLADKLLACSPHQPLPWLVKFWVSLVSGALDARSWAMLEQSYRVAPNEGWLAVYRNPVGVGAFLAAPDQVQSLVAAEFKGLVTSGYNWEAAQSYARAPAPVRVFLASALKDLEPGRRKVFSAALEAAGAEPLRDSAAGSQNTGRILVP